MANDQYSIIVDPVTFEPDSDKAVMDSLTTPEKKLVSYVLDYVQEWTYYRDTNFKDKWDEYYRLWRGIWQGKDKTRDSERSKLISPALSQAIEATVAEQEEATFGKGKWIDLSDDILDQDRVDADYLRNVLLEDFEAQKVPGSISEIYLNGAIYGTGIGKINVARRLVKKPIAESVQTVFGQSTNSRLRVKEVPEVIVFLEPVHPRSFVIDPTARSIDEGLGCAVTMVKPKHEILQKQEKGLYRPGHLGDYMDDEDVHSQGEMKAPTPRGKVKVIEYFGLVPRSLLEQVQGEKDEDFMTEEGVVDLFPTGPEEISESDLVEAFITIANESVLLKAIKNPYLMMDRPLIAYQHDTVPDRFWGRGISEKGYNPQKALDAELRARMDAMALAAHPMMAMDATRLPRGMQLGVRPGKNVLTTGNPNEVLMPFRFGNIDASTFHQSGELERMIQMGTGAMDSAAPISQNPRNQTASGMSMIAGASIKRTKRTMQNIERNFLVPLINKSLWRYMQYNPQRYPPSDFKLIPRSTLGIMAREYEQQQLTNLISTVPADSPAYWIILRGIFENSSIDNKEDMLEILNQHMEQVMNPEPPPPDPALELEAQKIQLEAQDKEAARMLDAERIRTDQERVRIEGIKAAQKEREMDIEAEKAAAEIMKKEADSILSVAKAEAEEIGANIEQYSASLQALQADNEGKLKNAEDTIKQNSQDQLVVLSAIDSLKQDMHSLASDISRLKNIEKETKVIEKEVKQTSGAMQVQKDYSSEFDKVNKSIDKIASVLDKHITENSKPNKIKRDKNGRILSVNGKKPKRNEQGLIEEI